jgi:hypothetical protein
MRRGYGSSSKNSKSNGGRRQRLDVWSNREQKMRGGNERRRTDVNLEAQTSHSGKLYHQTANNRLPPPLGPHDQQRKP